MISGINIQTKRVINTANQSQHYLSAAAPLFTKKGGVALFVSQNISWTYSRSSSLQQTLSMSNHYVQDTLWIISIADKIHITPQNSSSIPKIASNTSTNIFILAAIFL